MSYRTYKPVEPPTMDDCADVPSIAAPPKETKFLEGDEASIDAILNMPIVFTDWIILPSKYSKGEDQKEFLKLQFVAKDGIRTVTTGSTYLIDQIRKQEQLVQGGDKRFKAIIRKRGKAFVFEAVK